MARFDIRLFGQEASLTSDGSLTVNGQTFPPEVVVVLNTLFSFDQSERILRRLEQEMEQRFDMICVGPGVYLTQEELRQTDIFADSDPLCED